MGIRSRFRRAARAFRSEDWKTLYDYKSDKTAPLTFVSDLVSKEFTDKHNYKHLLKVAHEDPIGYRVCIGISHNVFDDWFIVKKKGKEEELEDHPDNEQIQEELEALNAKFVFTQCLIGERIGGRSFQVLNLNKHREDVKGNGYQLAEMDTFTDENAVIPDTAYDEKTGIPEHIVVYPNASNEQVKVPIPWDEVIFWNTRPIGRSFAGYSAMYSAWDLMVYLRESVDAMVWMHKKFGIGVWMWYIKGGMSDEVHEAAEDTFQNMGSRRAVTCETDQVDRVEWSGPPASGTNAIVEGADFTLGLISAGTDIPKDVFTGVSAGAITGSEINNKALYALINKIQSDITPYVLETIFRMGYDTSDMVIEWNTRYATDELEQAQIRLLNAQAAQMEMQAERGTDFEIGYGPNNPEKEQNPTGDQA